VGPRVGPDTDNIKRRIKRTVNTSQNKVLLEQFCSLPVLRSRVCFGVRQEHTEQLISASNTTNTLHGTVASYLREHCNSVI
jgi:hypothetical protein